MRPSHSWWLVIIAAFIGAGVWGWTWWQQYEEFAVIDIMASREPDLGLPVYAQFTVNQSLELSPPAEITAIVIPMYIPQSNQPMAIELQQDGYKVQRWRLRLGNTGTQDVRLLLDKPQLLRGKLEIIIDGTAIAHANQTLAPRLFTESDDAAYPGGHYRIADNDKQADISLQLIAQRTHGRKVAHDWQEEPLAPISQAALILATLIFASALPAAVVSSS